MLAKPVTVRPDKLVPRVGRTVGEPLKIWCVPAGKDSIKLTFHPAVTDKAFAGHTLPVVVPEAYTSKASFAVKVKLSIRASIFVPALIVPPPVAA
jgi:hypothetical protein